MKQEAVEILHKAIKKIDVKMDKEVLLNAIEIPKDHEIGDYAFPCFLLAKNLNQQPHDIALDLRERIGNVSKGFSDIQASGPYINFFVDRGVLAIETISEILRQKDNFGKGKSGKGKKIFVEFSSPNIAKPFGIGHLRSTIIGNSIANLCDFQGYKVIKANFLGDWGTQFGKLINAYTLFGNPAKLNKDPIKYLYELYVKINKYKKYEQGSRDWFKKLEQGNKDATRLWNDFKKLSIKEFDKIYSELGISFDHTFSESMYNNKLNEIVQELKEKKILRKSQGALIVSLKKYKLGVLIIQKTDGTTTYATRDLASAIFRKKKFNFTKMVYEVGQEQTLYFKQIFKILELMGYEWAKDCIHADHGLYLGKDKKRLATRKGKNFFMQDIISETKELAKKEILKKFPDILKKELEDRAHKVSIAAIFYGDLKNNRANNILFDLERFVSFEGDTGPYIQYSYARANSILEKSKIKENKKIQIKELEPKEIELTKKLSDFPSIVLKASESLNPSLIANYSYQLAQVFNEFYHICPVIGSKEKEVFRLKLVEAFKQVLKNSLRLLGIDVLEKM